MGQAAVAPGAGVLDDHRRLAQRTVLMQAGLGAALAVAMLALGHVHAVAGLLGGFVAGALDALLLVRGIDRLTPGISTNALTSRLLSRFVSVGVLVGLLMSTRALDPVAVVAGFMLFPLSLYIVGFRSALALQRPRGD